MYKVVEQEKEEKMQKKKNVIDKEISELIEKTDKMNKEEKQVGIGFGKMSKQELRRKSAVKIKKHVKHKAKKLDYCDENDMRPETSEEVELSMENVPKYVQNVIRNFDEVMDVNEGFLFVGLIYKKDKKLGFFGSMV